jgi:hypothetical protein
MFGPESRKTKHLDPGSALKKLAEDPLILSVFVFVRGRCVLC